MHCAVKITQKVQTVLLKDTFRAEGTYVGLPNWENIILNHTAELLQVEDFQYSGLTLNFDLELNTDI